jgi:hypothetical protein
LSSFDLPGEAGFVCQVRAFDGNGSDALDLFRVQHSFAPLQKAQELPIAQHNHLGRLLPDRQPLGLGGTSSWTAGRSSITDCAANRSVNGAGAGYPLIAATLVWDACDAV